MSLVIHGENPETIIRIAGAARRFFPDSPAQVVCLAPPGDEELRRLGGAGVETVHVLPENLTSQGPAVVAAALAKAVSKLGASTILLSATKYGREVGPRLAQRLGGSYATECIHVESVGEGLLVKRLVLGGAYQASLQLNARPYVIGVQAVADSTGGGAGVPRLERLDVDVDAPKIELLEVVKPEASHVDLERAEFIVGVGRGFKRREDLSMAEELAKILGAELGCSRPVSGDLKCMSEDRHIGLSGKRVRPKTYLALGISGQIQHLVGIRDSKLIIAVNTDPNAPIMAESDYAVVGDIYKIVPPLIERLREKLGRR
ncbi:MAG: electron transfer flavoprotein subunit alpha/FixB family protein [Nitrososphaerota archaeon]